MMLNIFDPEFIENPYPTYARLHKTGVIHRGNPPIPELEESWYVTGFDACMLALRNPSLVSDKSKATNSRPLADFSGPGLEFWMQIAEWPLILDDPVHAERRAVIASAFKQLPIQQLDKVVAQISSQLLDHALAKNDFEVMWDYAYPLSIGIICHVLGITGGDCTWLKNRTRCIVESTDFQQTMPDYQSGLIALNELKDFLHQQIKDKRKTADHGLISQLIQRKADNIDTDLILNLALMLLVIGQESTADAIGNSVLALSTHPETIASLRAEPALIQNATRELLRYESSVQFTGIRTAIEAIEIGSVKIAKGDSVIMAIGAANHDPKRFANPDTLNILRDLNGTELVFGQGIHYCLGVHLARLEIATAISDLTRRLPDIWETASFERRNTVFFRGLNSLRIRH